MHLNIFALSKVINFLYITYATFRILWFINKIQPFLYNLKLFNILNTLEIFCYTRLLFLITPDYFEENLQCAIKWLP